MATKASTSQVKTRHAAPIAVSRLTMRIRDVDPALLAPSATHTYCPYKGDASYYSITAGGARSVNAIWTYENPYGAVAEVKEHLAFYPTRVDAIEMIS